MPACHDVGAVPRSSTLQAIDPMLAPYQIAQKVQFLCASARDTSSHKPSNTDIRRPSPLALVGRLAAWRLVSALAIVHGELISNCATIVSDTQTFKRTISLRAVGGGVVARLVVRMNRSRRAMGGIASSSDGAGAMGSWTEQELAGFMFSDARLRDSCELGSNCVEIPQASKLHNQYDD